MTCFLKCIMVNGITTHVNTDTILHIDYLKDYLAVHFADETIMKLEKNCLDEFFKIKQ